MSHIRELCAICIALLVMWMAYYVAGESGWLYVYDGQVADLIILAGGLWFAQAALVQLVKGVLHAG
jgi:hypothetical protein